MSLLAGLGVSSHVPLISNVTSDTMTVQVNSDGDFAEDSLTDAESPSNPNVVADLYDILTKGDVEEGEYATVPTAYAASREIFTNGGGSDNDKWCKIGSQKESPEEFRIIEKTSDMDKEPNLGRYFWKAIGYKANQYTDFENKYQSEVDIRALDDVNEEGEYFKHLLVKAGIADSDETVHVPVNSNDELIPPFVAAKDDQNNLEKEIPDYEEGIDRLETLLNDHIEMETETVEDSANDNDDDGDSDEQTSPWESVHGVGAAMAEKLENDENAHYSPNEDYEPASRLYPEVSEPAEDSDELESRFSKENNHGVRIRTMDSQPGLSAGKLTAEVENADASEKSKERIHGMIDDGDLQEAKDFLDTLE